MDSREKLFLEPTINIFEFLFKLLFLLRNLLNLEISLLELTLLVIRVLKKILYLRE